MGVTSFWAIVSQTHLVTLAWHWPGGAPKVLKLKFPDRTTFAFSETASV
jgi:hypothetical protein